MPKDDVVSISFDEFWKDIRNEYLNQLSAKDPAEVYPSNNPGPTTPDGGVNFECHCVGHLVGSPCGYQFRQAITCQKARTDDEMQKGACGNELMSFMECVTRTECFKTSDASESK
ncbi:unnamed protein product [Caenorhabditis bovis]|uniref:CHCH domain-containing protein n=1 Tax=Caenorhabditis bovis TaxID=2654633 RepID=A0A8S1ER17_9PELO|nr:unnamed protein product [Caenorhabditis bovis]